MKLTPLGHHCQLDVPWCIDTCHIHMHCHTVKTFHFYSSLPDYVFVFLGNFTTDKMSYLHQAHLYLSPYWLLLLRENISCLELVVFWNSSNLGTGGDTSHIHSYKTKIWSNYRQVTLGSGYFLSMNNCNKIILFVFSYVFKFKIPF